MCYVFFSSNICSRPWKMIRCFPASQERISPWRKWESWPSLGTNRTEISLCLNTRNVLLKVYNKTSDKTTQGEAALLLWLHAKRRDDGQPSEESVLFRLFGHVWLVHGKQVFPQHRGECAQWSESMYGMIYRNMFYITCPNETF